MKSSNPNSTSSTRKKTKHTKATSSPSSASSPSSIYFVTVFEQYGLVYQPETSFSPSPSTASSSTAFPLLSSTSPLTNDSYQQPFGLALPPYQFKLNLKKETTESSWTPLLPKLETSILDYANQSIPHL
ncbi:hypothetical protein HMI54_013330, partial [Coelomomyces lativittatus]